MNSCGRRPERRPGTVKRFNEERQTPGEVIDRVAAPS